MVHESVMICIDTSEWMRNGDLSPTRFCCEQEAVRAVVQHKLRNHPENAVGLIAMAEIVHTLSSVTRDDRNLIMKINSLGIKGDAKVFIRAMKTAYLALRHRPNPHSKQRIIMFIGSPLSYLETEYTSGDFMKLAKKYKKEKLSIDFVLFGEAATDEKNQIITEFVDVLNGKETGPTGSHIVAVPSIGGDGQRLYDVVLRSGICRGSDGANDGAAPPLGLGGGDAGDLFGMDDEDPELAMALRISLEESRQQYQQQQNAVPVEMAGNQQETVEAPQAGQGEQQVTRQLPSEQQQMELEPLQVDPNAMTEEEQMEYALRMSMAGAESEQQQADVSGVSSSSGGAIDSSLLKPVALQQSNNQQQVGTSTGKTSGTQTPGTPNPTPMEVDEAGNPKDDVLGQLIQQPDLLKRLVEELPESEDKYLKDKMHSKKRRDGDDDKNAGSGSGK